MKRINDAKAKRLSEAKINLEDLNKKIFQFTLKIRDGVLLFDVLLY